jgi:hypothetical protein
VFVAQHVLLAETVVELIDIYGISFMHNSYIPFILVTFKLGLDPGFQNYFVNPISTWPTDVLHCGIKKF